MAWEIEFTDDFGEWWDGLTGDAQEDVNAGVVALRVIRPCSKETLNKFVWSSRHSLRG
jgi:hypothetical protein